LKKIAIVGPSGAGKSTLARELGDILQIPVYHLDSIYWKPGWIPSSRDEFAQIHHKIITKEQWIIDGTYIQTIEIRFMHADTIIFLDLPRVTCLYRVLKRWGRYWQKNRPDMGKDCPEKLDFPFLKWIWNYPKKIRPKILAKLQEYANSDTDQKQVFILRSANEISHLLKNARQT